MKKIVVLLVVMAFMSIAVSAFAATATGNLLVSTSVNKSCRISSVTNVSFTPYDPTNTSPNDSGVGDFTFRCTRGTSYDLYVTGTREMSNGTDNLNYELYQEAARTNSWPSGLPGVTGTSANNAPVTVDIYGRIPALQDVSIGAYSGTVTITVEY